MPRLPRSQSAGTISTVPASEPPTCGPTHPWVPDLGNGFYRNPIIHADYSDPDVIRVGGDFWMTASSFNCTPGLPILHSHDLVNWTLVNHALPRLPHPRYGSVIPGGGVWAPSLRFHDGWFWIFFPMPDEGIYVTRTRDPRQPWGEPWLLQAAKGWIDPCPFWDDDGTAYLAHAYACSRSGLRDRIHVRPMSADARRLLGDGSEIIHTPHNPYLEGPKVHKIDGHYYLMCPGGGVPTGWQVCFRSKSIWGPYEEKIVLERGSTLVNGPHQGALVDISSPSQSDGEWWFIHFQDAGAFGRITHLQPVEWKQGWPHIGVDFDLNGVGEPVSSWTKPSIAAHAPVAVPATSDEFDGKRLGLQWQWHANHDSSWASLTERPGWLRLRSIAQLHREAHLAPHFLGQKYPARRFSVETLFDPSGLNEGDIAGLAVVGGNTSALLGAWRGTNGWTPALLKERKVDLLGRSMRRPLCIRVDVAEDGTPRFSYGAPGRRLTPVAADLRICEGGWLGAKIGLVAFGHRADSSGSADFDYFRFGGTE
jgi:beta-xylosidase